MFDRDARCARFKVPIALACAAAVLAETPAGAQEFKPATVVSKPYARSARLPVVDAAKAMALFNAQRAAFGLPGDLVEDPAMSAACLNHVTLYHPLPDEFPHGETPGQPGYTPEGALAATRSSLTGRPNGKYNVGGEWTRSTYPWLGASFHEASLMDPAATTAWYGGSRSAACMGTAGKRQFPGPTFVAYPGQGAKGVPTSIVARENPFPPQVAVGMKEGVRVGQAIVLWPVQTDSTLQSAQVTDEKGRMLRTRLLLPSSPIPDVDFHPGYPQSGTISLLTGPVAYVVPTVKYRRNTTYTLTANWVDSAGVTRQQTTSFTTGRTSAGKPLERAQRRFVRRLPLAALRATVSGRRLTIRAIGAVRGERVRVFTTRCTSRACSRTYTAWSKRVVLRSPRTTIRIPPIRAGGSRTRLTVRFNWFSDPQAAFRGGQTSALLPYPGR
jgi:hypothetical protein